MTRRLEVTVTYIDGRREVMPYPRIDDEMGRNLTGREAFDLMARDDVTAVAVEPVERYAGGGRNYR